MMDLQSSLPFYPHRLLAQGFAVLGLGAIFAIGGVFMLASPASYSIEIDEFGKESRSYSSELEIDLGLGESRPYVPFPALDNELYVSLDPPRPDGGGNSSLRVRLKKTAMSKNVTLPCRLDLRYLENEKIIFTEEGSAFWIELYPISHKEIEAKVFAQGLSSHPKAFILSAQENPLFSLDELPVGSPFRFLAEGRWWGRDLFCEKYCQSQGLAERIEIGPLNASEIIDLKPSDWIAWDEGKWKKIASLEEGRGKLIAHIHSTHGKELILEGWDLNGHYRFLLNPAPPSPFKARPEELLTAIRVRSDKQISCMIEKQCLIVKTGDWVFKGDGKWRVLRKKEEREALLAGKLIGEIFVFDKIETKQMQKMIQGHLFNLSRSQSIVVDLPAQSMRAAVKMQDRKSRARPR